MFMIDYINYNDQYTWYNNFYSVNMQMFIVSLLAQVH